MAITAKNISVTFPGVKALDSANFGFCEGRIHETHGFGIMFVSTGYKVKY